MNTGTLNNLVTTYSFKGKEFLVNLSSAKNLPFCIEIKVTDKTTHEEWIGSYDAAHIENLTQKTGNFKRFDTFVSMLKSGFLRTSQCISLDLLTFDDLDMLRNRKSNSRASAATGPNSSQILGSQTNNKRYLLVTYTVEFDRIHYPLVMEYCGPPDPRILQKTIVRLEKQISDLQNQLNGSGWEDITYQIDTLQKKVMDVTNENVFLKEQIKKQNNSLKHKHSYTEIEVLSLMRSIHSLENRLQIESATVEKLKIENSRLTLQLEEVVRNEQSLRAQLNTLQVAPTLKHLERKFQTNLLSLSPSRNRSLENVNVAEKPFRRQSERKTCSARSSIARSSSEDSIIGNPAGDNRNSKRLKQGFQFKVLSRVRASSPTFSDFSHNSAISRCACRNCLRTKYTLNREDLSGQSKKQGKRGGKGKLLERIQSLEKLVKGIILN